MPDRAHVFLSYGEEDLDLVEALARKLQGDARLSFWFGPWHSVPGEERQEQMERALEEAQSCAVFIGPSGHIKGWQSEQMRTAIQRRVEDTPRYRIIPVFLPGVTKPPKSRLPAFLRRYEPVELKSLEDEQGFKRLLAGILGIPPIQVDPRVSAEVQKEKRQPPPTGAFAHGRALVIGIAGYPNVRPLPESVLNDARDMKSLLTDPARCGYLPENVAQLLDGEATGRAIRDALTRLAEQAGPDDTVIVFFSGHGAREASGGGRQYIIPFDCSPDDLRGTAIDGEEMTGLLRAIKAGRLVVFFDACHSGGVGEPKGGVGEPKVGGFSEDYYQELAKGAGRVVIASSRPDEVSWVHDGMRNSLFTHHTLAILRGEGKTLGDGYVRVFDVFRHVADRVPKEATQHPIFKATAMEQDFPVALARP